MTMYLRTTIAKTAVSEYYLIAKSYRELLIGNGDPEPLVLKDDEGVDTDSVVSDWYGKTFISLGTSITFQDGKVYAGTPNIARGYQTIIKEKLGFSSYINAGASGKAMADETSSGDGIVTVGKSQNYSSHSLAIIEAGTNDFKLNVPLGDIGHISDSEFDRSTFYGAYKTLIEFILIQNPNIRLVLFIPLHRNNGNYHSWRKR